MEKNSRIYVAGHRGLVGSAIWKTLSERGYSHLIGRTHSELDLQDAAAVRSFFEQERPEYVVLAAAHVGGIMANNSYRADFIFNNLQIQQHVIGESFRCGVKKLLFLGSTCIYPREAPQPMSEDCLLTSPLEYTNEPYAIAKIAGLKLCESLNIQYGTNFIAVMPTNLYGPNDNFDLEKSHVLPAILRKMHLAKCLERNDFEALRSDLARRPVPELEENAKPEKLEEILARYGIFRRAGSVCVEIWGSGRPLREFLWSEDMAEACVFLMEQVDFEDVKRLSVSPGSKEIRNCHINIGTGKEVSIAQLAATTQELVGFGGRIVFNTDKPDGSLRKLTDPGKLHKLGWEHRVELEEGIKLLYQWYLGEIQRKSN